MQKESKIIAIFLIILSGCSNYGDNQNTNSELERITVNVDDAKQYSFFELYDTSRITYIQLESTSESLMGEIKKFYTFNNSFICISNKKIAVFDLDGKFLYSIDNRGKGPGEYLSLDDVYCDSTSIYILDRQGKKIIEYNTKGEFLSTINTGLHAESFTKINEDIFCLYIGSNKNEVSSNRVNYYSQKKKKIIHKAIPITEKEYQWMYFFDFNNFCVKNNVLLFKYSFNDRIYSLNEHGLTPYILIDWGQYRIPDKVLNEKYSDILDFNDKTDGKYIYSTLGLFSNSTHLSFGFRLKDALYQALYNWEDNSIKIISAVSNPYSIIGRSSVDFSLLPHASDGDFFYTLLEHHFIMEISKETTNLPIPFHKLDANKNPIVTKYKYRL